MPRTTVVPTLSAGRARGPGCRASGTGPQAAASPSRAGACASAGPATDDPTAGAVAPATGVRLTMPRATVRAPRGWTRSPALVSDQTDAEDDDTASAMTLAETQAFGSTAGADELADIARASNLDPMIPRKLPAVELDGVEVYHLAGKVQRLNYLEEFGAVVDDRIVTLSFQLSPEITPTERREIVDSVLATFRWR